MRGWGAAACLLPALATSCGKGGGGVTGQWTGTWTSPSIAGGRPEAATLTYNADGTAVSEMATPFGQATASMTYRLDGDTLTQTMSSGTLAGRDIPLAGPPPPEVYRIHREGNGLTLVRTDTPTRISLRRAPR